MLPEDTTGLNTPTPTPPLGEGTPTPQPGATPQPQPTPDPMVPLARFESVTAQKWDAIREAERVKAELAQANSELERLRAGGQTPPASGTSATPPAAPLARVVAPQADVDARARQMLFDQRCVEVANEGKKAHTDFDAALDALRGVSPLIDAIGRPALPQTLIEAAIETGLGSEVLYALGKNTAEADRIMTLPPVKQAVEVARFAEGLRPRSDGAGAPEARVSGAPPPIKPVVNGRAAISPNDLPLDSPDLPMAEFIKRRDAEEKARRASGRRI